MNENYCMTGSKKVVRLSKAAREFNISIDSVVIFLKDRGYEIERNPNTKLEPEMYNQLSEEFRVEKEVKEISRKKDLEYVGKDSISIDNTVAKPTREETKPHVEEELMIKNIQSLKRPKLQKNGVTTIGMVTEE